MLTVGKKTVSKTRDPWDFLVVQRLRICLSMQVVSLQSLVGKLRSHVPRDPTIPTLSVHTTTKELMHQNKDPMQQKQTIGVPMTH